MDTPNDYSRHGMGEGHPGNIHPDEAGRKEPSKYISATEQLHIKESQLGHDMGQTPADEHIDHSFSQIDNDSEPISDAEHEENMRKTMEKEFDTDDFKRVDERDNSDSREDWDAERSRTGRHK